MSVAAAHRATKHQNDSASAMKHFSPEYIAIKRWYGARKAKRSSVPLINHINEGIDLLRDMGASDLAVRAFCLHPLAQDPSIVAQDWLHNRNFSRKAIELAKQYARIANSFLCTPETDHYTITDLRRVVGSLSQAMIHMLVADKIQNEKDFEIHHKGKHPRSEQLAHYFDLWLEYLDVMEKQDYPQ